MRKENHRLTLKDYQHFLDQHPTLTPEEINQLARDIQALEEEANLQLDEASYQMNDRLLNSLQEALKHLVKIGKLTAEEAADELASLEDYLMNIPEVEQRLHDKNDRDGWLSAWLTRHPEYVEEDLGGEWPDWLKAN